LKRGAVAHRFATELWTLGRVGTKKAKPTHDGARFKKKPLEDAAAAFAIRHQSIRANNDNVIRLTLWAIILT